MKARERWGQWNSQYRNAEKKVLTFKIEVEGTYNLRWTFLNPLNSYFILPCRLFLLLPPCQPPCFHLGSDWSVALYLIPNLKMKGLADKFVMSARQIYKGEHIQGPDELIGRGGVWQGERQCRPSVVPGKSPSGTRSQPLSQMEWLYYIS